MKVSDRTSGALLLALGAITCWGAYQLAPVPGQQIGPGVFPTVIGVGLMLCGVLILVGVGRSFEEDERIVASETGELAEASAASPGNASADGTGAWKAVLPPAMLFFYYFASERLGFWLTATLMVLVLARAQGARWRGSLLLALLAPPLVHLVFYKLLRVPLPAGLLGLPWV
ncbi:MAG: tripartite tricarboxylate transporter TctB family protein [Betaproteobacteria bacterium]|nr:tripartite tricarboxylate transporter TctB family protein [Betaproteobacteria bacterium]